MNRKLYILSGLIIIVLIITAFSDDHGHDHSGHDHSEAKATDHDQLPDESKIGKETQFMLQIETELIQKTRKSHIDRLNGRVRSTTSGSSHINAPYRAVIIKVFVGIGQNVKEGQQLAVIRQNVSAVDQLEISSRLREVNAQLQSDEAELKRLENLSDIVEGKRIINLKIEIDKLKQLQREYSELVASGGGSTTLVAPISGKLNDFKITEGTQVHEGQELFGIFNSNQVLVEAIVYDQNMINETDSLAFTISDIGEKNIIVKGVKMISISPELDIHTQTSKITLAVDNSKNLFKPGQAVLVGVSKFTSDLHIQIPNSAISSIEGKPTIFLHTAPEKFKTKFIRQGSSDGQSTEVLDGLEEGDRVVVSGVYSVKSIYLSK